MTLRAEQEFVALCRAAAAPEDYPARRALMLGLWRLHRAVFDLSEHAVILDMLWQAADAMRRAAVGSDLDMRWRAVLAALIAVYDRAAQRHDDPSRPRRGRDAAAGSS